jgi:hypothetical protein
MAFYRSCFDCSLPCDVNVHVFSFECLPLVEAYLLSPFLVWATFDLQSRRAFRLQRLQHICGRRPREKHKHNYLDVRCVTGPLGFSSGCGIGVAFNVFVAV